MAHHLRRNIEIKARCDDLNRARRAAEAIGAKFAGVLHQIDTYFHVKHGRLKLRQINGNQTELIWYERPDRAEARASNYYVVPVTDADLTLAALSAALGVRGAVRKRRELFLWDNVRIHLDRVERLGEFIEFEAFVSDAASETVSSKRLDQLSGQLHIGEQIGRSYSDLLGF